jgi:hypothetical protein
MSHFFYIHKDLKDKPGVHKIGITIAPYSAVRARQKFCWDAVQLDHLYFGVPCDIRILETTFKQEHIWQSGKKLNRRGGQSELFKMEESDILDSINLIIDGRKLKVHKIVLEKPYTASSAGQCPLRLPTESQVQSYCDKESTRIFGIHRVIRTPSAYNIVF